MRNILLMIPVLLIALGGAFAQGVTTSGLTGQVIDSNGNGLPGTTITAVHTPSGTQNLNLRPSVETLSGTPDERPIFVQNDRIYPTYQGIFLASNTSKDFLTISWPSLQRTLRRVSPPA